MGRDLFFYGTLRDLPLLKVVMGDALDTLAITEATLDGYLVSAVAEGPFPTIQRDTASQAVGLLVQGLTAEHIKRLDFYEGSFDYDLVAATLTNGVTAEFYLSQMGRWTPTQPWSFDAWLTTHGAMNTHAAIEVMQYYGTKTRDEVAAIFPRIRARAASKARAGQSTHGSGTLFGKVDVINRTRVHNGFYGLDEITLSHEKFDGTMLGPLDREVFMPSDSAMVLPYDPVRDCVLVVEQMRLGPLGRGDNCVWQLEPIAGLIDPGEAPHEAARREAFEEAGITLTSLEAVSQAYSSPGNSAEFSYTYVGIADLSEDTAGTGGLASEGENIRSHVLSFDDLMTRIESFDIANAPLVICALWLARHRSRLRSG